MEKNKQLNDDFNVKKPKKKGLIIACVIIAVIAIAAALVYFLVLSKPQRVFDAAIDKMFNAKTEEFDSIKIDTSIKASVETEMADEKVQEILSEIGKCTFDVGMQFDAKSKQEVVDLGIKYNNQNVVNAREYYNEGELYVYFDELFDKYIKIDMEDEQKEQIEEIFDMVSSKENTKNSKKAMAILGDELKSGLKEYGEFSREKEKIEVGDKEIKATKSTVNLSGKKLCKMFSGICSNLANNDKFLDCFEDERKELKEGLKNFADELKNADSDEIESMKISIYTKGLLNTFVGVEGQAIAEIGYTDQTIIAKLIKEDKDTYSYIVSTKEGKTKTDIIKADIQLDKTKDSKNEKEGKATITAEVPEAGKIKLEVNYSIELNNGVEKINVKNSVGMDEITEDDLQAILEKLKDRPLIGELIESYMDNSSRTTPSISPNTTLTTGENEVKDDDSGYSVKYSVPVGFEYENDYSYDYSKYYSLDENDSEIDANVSIDWSTEDEYKEDDINWDYDYYKNDNSYYKNPVLSEEKTITVGDKTFKYQILSYESNSEYYQEKYQKAYVWYKLNDEYLFTVELESTDMDITEDIISGFLNINITEI